MNTPESEKQRGIVCPKCGCKYFEVLHTRSAFGGRILRQRECRHCGWRISTAEKTLFSYKTTPPPVPKAPTRPWPRSPRYQLLSVAMFYRCNDLVFHSDFPPCVVFRCICSQ